ncbi:MAG: antibiotic biosynthesis monooxygenase [Ardenticatenaceae bacterium]|nr:antibiotic biosynthesis monooxygenase [Ardenticatenaceae bacterium]
MIVLLAKYYVKPGNAETVIEKLREMGELVKANEPGCTMYQISRAQDNPDFLLLYEQYIDQAAVDAHRATPHFQTYILDTIIPMLEKREVAFFDLVIQ